MGDADAKKRLAQLDKDLESAQAELRTVVDALRPPALDRGLTNGLHTAVRRYEGTALHIALSVGDLPEIPAASEVAAFRVVEEAIANIVRHANATTAHVAVQGQDGNLVVTVVDDGVGFDPRRGDRGVGLESMENRCEELGGTFMIDSTSRGTTLTATFPWD